MRLGKLRTVEYAALEAAGGVRGDDVRSDVFFLGRFCISSFLGVHHSVNHVIGLYGLIPNDITDFEPLGRVAPHLPRDLVDVVNKMLSIKPKHRFQTVLEVHEALKPIQLRCQKTNQLLTPDVAGESKAGLEHERRQAQNL